MNTGALFTRGTIWLALLCYAAAMLVTMRRRAQAPSLARAFWTLGCVFFLAHLAAAFHFYHEWSHTAAAQDTQGQTLERLGMSFGAGIYFNYAFAAVWLADCVWWWSEKAKPQARKGFWWSTLQIFFLFMIFNSTVVFGHGLAKPAGFLICFIGVAALARTHRRRAVT